MNNFANQKEVLAKRVTQIVQTELTETKAQVAEIDEGIKKVMDNQEKNEKKQEEIKNEMNKMQNKMENEMKKISDKMEYEMKDVREEMKDIKELIVKLLSNQGKSDK